MGHSIPLSLEAWECIYVDEVWFSHVLRDKQKARRDGEIIQLKESLKDG
jgi:hypothetical protein